MHLACQPVIKRLQRIQKPAVIPVAFPLFFLRLALIKKCEIKNPAVIWGKGQPATSSCPFSAFLVNTSHATRMFLIPSSPLLSLTADFLSGGVSLTQ